VNTGIYLGFVPTHRCAPAEEELDDAFKRASNEALASFGWVRLLLLAANGILTLELQASSVEWAEHLERRCPMRRCCWL